MKRKREIVRRLMRRRALLENRKRLGGETPTRAPSGRSMLAGPEALLASLLGRRA